MSILSVLSGPKSRTERRLERKRAAAAAKGAAKSRAMIDGMRAAISQVVNIENVTDDALVAATLEAVRRQRAGEDKGPLPALILRLLGVVASTS